MTLIIQDGNNQQVSFPSLLETELNGLDGEESIIELNLVNKGEFVYRKVSITVVPKTPIDMSLSADQEAGFTNKLSIPEIRADGKATFYLRVKIPKGTKTQILEGSILQTDSVEYPV